MKFLLSFHRLSQSLARRTTLLVLYILEPSPPPNLTRAHGGIIRDYRCSPVEFDNDDKG
jgi:hypothetical protein